MKTSGFSYGNVRVTVYGNVVQANFEYGASKSAEQVGRSAVINSKALVGKRTGYLATTITFGRQPIGRLRYLLREKAGAGYAAYVESGTTGPIVGNHGFLRLRAGNGFPAFNLPTPPYSVSGQNAQHFLRDGMRDALTQHGF